MREKKFRAWNRVEKKMSEPFSFEDFDCTYFIPECWYLVDMDIVEYTGLHDKNGNEVYEGDVVVMGKRRDEVKYGDSGFSPFAFAEFGDEGYYANECEVIGNIYENPDLLTKDTQPFVK